MSKTVKFYNNATRKMDTKCVLTKGEQYDLIKRNQALLQSSAEISDEEFAKLYREVVSYADTEFATLAFN